VLLEDSIGYCDRELPRSDPRKPCTTSLVAVAELPQGGALLGKLTVLLLAVVLNAVPLRSAHRGSPAAGRAAGGRGN